MEGGETVIGWFVDLSLRWHQNFSWKKGYIIGITDSEFEWFTSHLTMVSDDRNYSWIKIYNSTFCVKTYRGLQSWVENFSGDGLWRNYFHDLYICINDTAGDISHNKCSVPIATNVFPLADYTKVVTHHTMRERLQYELEQFEIEMFEKVNAMSWYYANNNLLVVVIAENTGIVCFNSKFYTFLSMKIN